jgi:geranylgeranyl diphosphate synthase, type I
MSNSKLKTQDSLMIDTLRELAGVVEKRLDFFFDNVASKSLSPIFDTRPVDLVHRQVRDLTLRGGKRLRAVLLIQGAALFDEKAVERKAIVDAASGMEILQTYFLIHDDIMDDDETRRGGPTVHTALTKEFGNAKIGRGLGILAGDLAAALWQQMLVELDVDPSTLHKVFKIFSAMHVGVIYGQTLDMLDQHIETSALDIAIRKTANYTTIAPLTAGAALAGATDEEILRLSAIARPLGIAFQFRDDLLGTFGQPEVTGKPVGNDLRAGKKTVLIEEGLARANPNQRLRIEAVLGVEDADTHALQDACLALEECGARDACRKRIGEQTAEFSERLAKENYLNPASEFLLAVGRYVAERER